MVSRQDRMLSIAAAHNMEADAIEGTDSIMLHIPWSRATETGLETGVESEAITSEPDLWVALGY